MPSCLAQVSPIECIFALSEADANGDYALDRNEYQAVLLDLAAAQNEGGCRIDSVALQSQYDEAACSCQTYNTGATTLPKATTQAAPTCLCRQAGATIAVPQVYPAAYSLTICHALVQLLQTSCAAVVVVGTDRSSTTTMGPHSEMAPQTSATSSTGKVPMSAMFASVVIVGAIVGATSMAVWLRLNRRRRRRRSTGQAPGHKQSLDSSGQGHNKFIDEDLHRWASAAALKRDSADPSGRTTCTAVLDDDSDCWTEAMEEGSVSPVASSSPLAYVAAGTDAVFNPRLRSSDLNVCHDNHVGSSCALMNLLQLPTLEAKSSCGDTDTDDDAVHDAPPPYCGHKDWPETTLREARASSGATTMARCHSNSPALDTSSTDAAENDKDDPISGLGDQNAQHDSDSDDSDNASCGDAPYCDEKQPDTKRHEASASSVATATPWTMADCPDGNVDHKQNHGGTTLGSHTTTTTSTSTKQRSHGHKALVCHRRKRPAVVVVRSVKMARAAYMAQARSVRSGGGARLLPIPEATLTRAQRITI
jgi:hypothetical protein